MGRVRLPRICTTPVIAAAVGGPAVAQAWPLTLSRLPAAIEAHCADCHAGGGKHHGFDLDRLRLAPGPVREAAASRAMQRVRTRSMPPADAGELPEPTGRCSDQPAAVAGEVRRSARVRKAARSSQFNTVVTTRGPSA